MTQDLFDREKLSEIYTDCVWHERVKPLFDFFQSECQRNRIEAVTAFAERVRPREIENTGTWTHGANCMAHEVNAKIDAELSKLQTKEGGE